MLRGYTHCRLRGSVVKSGRYLQDTEPNNMGNCS